jgi:hypothetical protein
VDVSAAQIEAIATVTTTIIDGRSTGARGNG